jgi:glycosyltransferase involved in cell wall biosynthesis
VIEVIDVVVPARNEEELLPRCLEALLTARGHLTSRQAYGSIPEVRIVVVLDSCVDGSSAVADAHARAHAAIDVVAIAAGSAGAARAHGVAHALALAGPDASRRWICTTDADSEVPETWLATHLEAARRDAALTLGRVVPRHGDLPEHFLDAWRTAYAAEEGPVHGANLGVRADLYLAAGGFSALVENEDVALVRAVQQLGEAITIIPDSVVTTSGRLRGRAPGGFADYLRALGAVPGESA